MTRLIDQTITIVNTQAGNLYSLKAALEKIGNKVVIADTPDQVVGEKLVIPGQGRFGTVMSNLTKNDWVPFLNQWREQHKLILGICVGMQIFFEGSAEDPDAIGLGWFEGKAAKLDFPKKPMVGWAPLTIEKDQSLPSGMPYFVNSYAIREAKQCIAQTTYGETFCAAVKQDNICGFQFHPEKSSQYGLEILASQLNYQ
ncbi:MAG: imidazole glycerol phosphate synthase subunit HisH [Kangiellaceae bacterium]|jgi:imidazole glycerol phosphate synthase glutamine amidotransferase subunit|nr:imidazole glycerol phosphate synthase subunit HisH [Kangiellaceae bacterium]